MDSSVTLKPLTKEGAAWVRAYTHPPSEEEKTGSVEGIPDNSTHPSTVMNFINDFQIQPPAGVGTGNWTCLLIALPDPQFPLVALRWVGELPPLTGITDDNFLIYQNDSWDFGSEAVNWEATASRYRPVKFSVTSRPTVADLYNQGNVYAAQGGIDQIIPPRNQLPSPNPDRLTVSTYLDRVPVTPGQVLQMSPKSYKGESFMDGCFQVLRFVDPTALYAFAAPKRNIIQMKYTANTNITFEQTVDLTDDSPPVGQTLSVSPYPSMSVGYTLYTQMLTQASLTAKVCHGWEVVPDAGSILTVFAKSGPCPDQPALDLGAVEMYKMKDGLPAAANDLGTFWNAAKSLGPVLKQVWNVAKPALQTGIGAMVPGGGLLNQVIDSVERMALEDSRPQKKKKMVQQQPFNQGQSAPQSKKAKKKMKAMANMPVPTSQRKNPFK